MAKLSTDRPWTALVLAGGRGPNDPMARAYGVTHKCLLPVAGRPMLARVVDALNESNKFNTILISIEHPSLVTPALGATPSNVSSVESRESAAASALHALSQSNFNRTLLTTADHPLLTPEIINNFLETAHASDADMLVGLATATTIRNIYPSAERTYLKFSDVQVSGCNLFAMNSKSSLLALKHWQFLEKNRKKPWRLILPFGPIPLIRYALGRLDLDGAFAAASNALGFRVQPVLLPFADAAIDVDKPTDLMLAEKILTSRAATNRLPSAARTEDHLDSPLHTIDNR